MNYYLPFGPAIKLGQPYGSNPGVGPNPPGGHNGDDWLTPIGTPVRAAGDGVILHAGQFDDTYADNWGWNLHYGGVMVVLNTDGANGPYFEYGHLSRALVKAGDRVKAGQVIAYTGNTDGNTGVSTGPHCHVGALPPNFDLGTNTYGRVNPRRYMTRHWTEPKAPAMNAVIEYIRKIALTGWTHKGVPHPGFMLVGEETQRRVDALTNDVAELNGKVQQLLDRKP